MKNKEEIIATYYYIKNVTDEHHSHITRRKDTEKEIMKALKTCQDCYCKKGTGTVYKRDIVKVGHDIIIKDEIIKKVTQLDVL